MKLGQLIDYNMSNIFLQNYAESEIERLVQASFYFVKLLNMR